MIEVDMKLIEQDKLEFICIEVIEVLKKYPHEYKLAALHILLSSFPEKYELIEVKNG
jgi:hypothetical protein